MMKMSSWLSGFFIVGLITFGMGCSGGAPSPPEGTWSCTTQWSGEENGVSITMSSVVQNTCVKGALASSGTLSIGDAQWSEAKQGTCYATENELYGTWSSLKTIPKNQAALAFEAEQFGGLSLSKGAWGGPAPYRVKVMSRTEKEMELVDPENRRIACRKL
jgi:hypothetical protein